MRKDDVAIILLRQVIDSIIKYTLRPELATHIRRKDFSEYTKEKTLIRQNYRCNICKEPLFDDKEFDHINGNSYDNSPLNCQALHPNCHSKKTRLERMQKNRLFHKGSRVQV